jgi:hypothetical protein
MLSCNGGGAMIAVLGTARLRLNGYAVLFENQLFLFAAEREDSNLAFGILNLVSRLKAEVLDGLVLTRHGDSSGSPVAMRMLLERVGDLTGDDEDDMAKFEALCSQSALLPPEAVPENVRKHLCPDFGPTAFANGGELLLTMHVAQSMSRGTLVDGA